MIEKAEKQGISQPIHSNPNDFEPAMNTLKPTINSQSELIKTSDTESLDLVNTDSVDESAIPSTAETVAETSIVPAGSNGQCSGELSETAEPVSDADVPKKDIVSETYTLLLQLAKDFETKLKYDTTKQAQIDKLYNENQSFKEGLLKKFQRSLILAVIEQIDDATKQISYFGNTVFSEENYSKLLHSYQEVATGFQNVLLEKFDVINYRCEPDTPFNPKRQRSLKTCPVSDQSKHKLVKQSLRSGYETDDGFVLRPEMVEVYVFDSQQSVT
jgi:molecular chaperone GrpE (heat shock protein)